jgi:hypothetical protein
MDGGGLVACGGVAGGYTPADEAIVSDRRISITKQSEWRIVRSLVVRLGGQLASVMVMRPFSRIVRNIAEGKTNKKYIVTFI